MVLADVSGIRPGFGEISYGQNGKNLQVGHVITANK